MFIALQGRPGSGKTTMAATMTKLGYHVHFIDLDEKIKTTHNLKELLGEGKISYVECPHPLNERSLSDMARLDLKKQFPTVSPKGYIWLCEYIEELPNLFEGRTDVIPVIDSLSSLNRHLKNLMRFYAKAPKLGFDGWDVILQNYQALFDTIKSMTPKPFPHFIINIHVRDDIIKDGEDTRVESRPFLDGQFRDELASYLEEFYFLEVETFGKIGTPKYVAYTKPVQGIKIARSSVTNAVKVNCDFKEILGEE